MTKEGIVVENGRYIALLICPEPQSAKEAFLECFGKATRNGENGTGNETRKTIRSILKAAKDVIRSEINDNMSDYEKELAIHDYITEWSRFGYSVFERSGSDGFTDRSDTPYGVLIDRPAMCHGYSSTFQLFMDMLDIECMTVFGTPR